MSGALLASSLIAGILSVLAPCVIGILPILMARSADGRQGRSPWWVIGGLAISIFIFSILLKSTTLLLGIPDVAWRSISGGIVALFGITVVWPKAWDWLAMRLGIASESQRLLSRAATQRGRIGDILLGASLGPVFSACSPTYLLIVATILPASPLEGLVYLTVYLVGLIVMIAAVLLLGRRLIKKLGWGLNPDGVFRRVVGILLIILGGAIIIGFDKVLLSWLVESGAFQWQVDIERQLQP